MNDLTSDENEDLLTVHPDDLAVEADEEIQYDPHDQSNVVIVEPTIITLGRSKRAAALRQLRDQQSQH